LRFDAFQTFDDSDQNKTRKSESEGEWQFSASNKRTFFFVIFVVSFHFFL